MKISNDLANNNIKIDKGKLMPIYDRSKTIIIFALQSRLFIFILQIFFNFLVPDHKPDVFNPPAHPSNTTSTPDAIMNVLFDGLTRRWDGLYFMFIAEYGYFYENTLVFFPLFPTLVKFLSVLFYPLVYLISKRNILHLSAVLLNTLAFSMAAKQLYKLSYKVLRSEHLAFRAAQLFCVNPASIFFSAAYSESLYSFLTFTGLLYLESWQLLKCACMFSLCTATRSNALINTAFIIFTFAYRWFLRYFRGDEYNIYKVKPKLSSSFKSFITFLKESIYLTLLITLSVFFFFTHQIVGYLFFCSEMRLNVKKCIPKELIKYGRTQGYTLPGKAIPPWCKNAIPFHYSSIQQKHWNVGLFTYYELKQIPNFILATPIIIISILTTISYLKINPFRCFFLGFVPRKFAFKRFAHFGGLTFKMVEFLPSKWGVFSERCFVYVAHLTSLTIFAVLFMHIQVTTRLLCSSCPIIYWYLAQKSLSCEEMMILTVLQNKRFKVEKGEGKGEDCGDGGGFGEDGGGGNRVDDDDSYKGDNGGDFEVVKGEDEKSEKNIQSDLKRRKVDNGNNKKGVENQNKDDNADEDHKIDEKEIDEDDYVKINEDIKLKDNGDVKCDDDDLKIDENKDDKDDDNEDEDSELTIKEIKNIDYKLLEEILADGDVLDWNNGCFNKLVSVYFHLYLFVGVALFSNFFPWT